MILHSSDNNKDFYSSKISHVDFIPPEWRLRGHGIFFAGSCFAEYLYKEFEALGLKAATSAFGNIYNPESLSKAVGILCGKESFIEAGECIKTTEGYRHFMFDSSLHAETAENLAKKINNRLKEGRRFIEEAEAAVLTLGTSFVFRLKDGNSVNNCHKLPADNFTRTSLTPETAAEALDQAVLNLQKINPEIKIILTLSPVRHLRDKPTENSFSKAVLRCAIESVVVSRQDHNIFYFPSYEIMLDEMRDYRWYADDLCHPSEQAVSYIISRFIAGLYDERFKTFLSSWLKVQRDLSHRPFNPDSEDYKKFREKALLRQEQLRAEFPDLF